ncbi:protein of unknown function [Candidatus Methylomirabilis oxygeniifera]|uniref:Uncharacterized protein n=1 Tax=Methylomirabilis oxygeniifera TaxID=671143 RepID=D5MIJ6_METO1|nr:protein of unknown function [Candidatus Methylomirabilis oxyfera]
MEKGGRGGFLFAKGGDKVRGGDFRFLPACAYLCADGFTHAYSGRTSHGKGTAQPSVRPELVEGCSAHGSTGSP